jgi:hypothetical protein
MTFSRYSAFPSRAAAASSSPIALVLFHDALHFALIVPDERANRLPVGIGLAGPTGQQRDQFIGVRRKK